MKNSPPLAREIYVIAVVACCMVPVVCPFHSRITTLIKFSVVHHAHPAIGSQCQTSKSLRAKVRLCCQSI